MYPLHESGEVCPWIIKRAFSVFYHGASFFVKVAQNMTHLWLLRMKLKLPSSFVSSTGTVSIIVLFQSEKRRRTQKLSRVPLNTLTLVYIIRL